MAALLAIAGGVHLAALNAVANPRPETAYTERYVTHTRPCYFAAPVQRVEALPAEITLDRPAPDEGRCARTFALHWHWPEPGNAWTSAPVAELAVVFADAAVPKRLLLLLGVFGGEERPRELRIAMNGVALHRQSVATNASIELDLPLGDAGRPGENRLRFEVDFTRSPAELYGELDRRQLGARFARIGFQ